MLARSGREPSDDWPTLFSGEAKMIGELESGFIGQCDREELIGRNVKRKRA
jgi:hypothetical protein